MQQLVKFYLTCSLFVAVSLHICYAQELKIVPPAPNAMKMTEYYAQRPNMYTGTANVSIPLYTIDFDGWELPLSISYNATGIRTAEEASEVGLGWALNATGVVSRTVRGGDDFYQGTLNGNGLYKGYVYNTKAVPDPFNMGYDQFTQKDPASNSYYLYLASNRPDTQPDIFNYSFFGYSGQFILSQKVKTGSIGIIKLTEDATSLIFNESDMTFTIITPSGFKGVFTAKELSTTLPGKRDANTRERSCDEDMIDIVTLENNGQLRVITSWYLTSITSPRGREIVFTYDLQYFDTQANGQSLYISNSRAFGEDEQIAQSPLCIQNIHENVYLKNIKYAGVVDINFAMEERKDIRRNVYLDQSSAMRKIFPLSYNPRRYTGISINGASPSTLNKQITFSQSYFNEGYQDAAWMRSRLDRVIIDDQEYLFSYYKGAKGLPNKQTQAVDHFGFYNGQDDNAHLLWPTIVGGLSGPCDLTADPIRYYTPSSQRLPDFSYGQAGLLKQVKYPTRGYTVFEYEGHTYMPEQAGRLREQDGLKNAGGARIKSIKEYNYDNVIARQRFYRYSPLGSLDPLNSDYFGTTGLLMTPLLNLGKAPRYIYGLSTGGVNDCDFVVQSNSSIPGNNAAEGKIIGYTTVHEIIDGVNTKYKNTYVFENKSNKVLNTLLALEGYANINGQAKTTRNYDSDAKLVQLTVNSGYDSSLPNPVQGVAYRESAAPSEYTYLGYWQDYKINRNFVTPTSIIVTTSETPSGLLENTDGSVTGNALISTKRFNYSNYLLSSQWISDSNNSWLQTYFNRPKDYGAGSSPSIEYMKRANVNIIDPVIEQFTLRNGVVTDATANKFDLANGIITQSASYAYNSNLGSWASSLNGYDFPSPYELKSSYTSYGDHGKIQEYKSSDWITHSFIWGDEVALSPIVHGVGINYTQLKAAYDAAKVSGVGTPAYETALRNHSNTIGKQITSYVHNPLVGISKVTDPAGLKKSFDYDSYSRLQRIKDKDDKTLEQYQYHFRERLPTKILTISGDLNFGTLTPDMYAPQFLPEYVKCSEPIKSKILTFSNAGEDFLKVNAFVMPDGFTSSWLGGIIPPGESLDAIIRFDNTKPTGTYNRQITIGSDRTDANGTLISTPLSVSLSANYINRTCSLIAPTPIVDFGTQTGSSFNKAFTVRNDGNAAVRLIAVPVNWNGQISSYYPVSPSAEFSIVESFGTANGGICINPGQTITLHANFIVQPGTTTSIRYGKLSFITDTDPAVCQASYKDLLTFQASYEVPRSSITTDITAINIVDYVDAQTRIIRVSSNGNIGLNITGFQIQPVTPNDPAVANYFTITPTILPGQPIKIGPASQGYSTYQDFTVKINPSVFGSISANIKFLNDATAGNATVAFSGNKKVMRKIVVTPSDLSFEATGAGQNVTITNYGNDVLVLGTYSPQPLQGWTLNGYPSSRSLLPGSSSTVPGESVTLQALKGNEPIQDPLTVSIGSNSTEGNNTFTLRKIKREVTFTPTHSPGFAIPPFNLPVSNSETFKIKNTGTVDLYDISVVSSNSQFVVSFSPALPANLTVGQEVSGTVTFTPPAYTFTTQSAVLTLRANVLGGANTPVSSATVSGTRTRVNSISLSPSPLNFSSGHSSETLYVTNTGNSQVTLTGVNYTVNGGAPFQSSSWSASISNQATPLSPGDAPRSITVQSISSAPVTETLNVLGADSPASVLVSKVTKGMTLTYPVAMTQASNWVSRGNLVIGNNGNTTFTVSSISSSNAKFKILVNGQTSFTPFAIGGGASFTAVVEYTGTDFSTQSTFISVSADNTEGTTATEATATLNQITQWTVSSIDPTYINPRFPIQKFSVINSGNTSITVALPSSIASGFVLKYMQGGAYITPPLSYSLAAGSILYLEISAANNSYTTGSGTVTIAVNGTQYDRNISKAPQ